MFCQSILLGNFGLNIFIGKPMAQCETSDAFVTPNIYGWYNVRCEMREASSHTRTYTAEQYDATTQ